MDKVDKVQSDLDKGKDRAGKVRSVLKDNLDRDKVGHPFREAVVVVVVEWECCRVDLKAMVVVVEQGCFQVKPVDKAEDRDRETLVELDNLQAHFATTLRAPRMPPFLKA